MLNEAFFALALGVYVFAAALPHIAGVAAEKNWPPSIALAKRPSTEAGRHRHQPRVAEIADAVDERHAAVVSPSRFVCAARARHEDEKKADGEQRKKRPPHCAKIAAAADLKSDAHELDCTIEYASSHFSINNNAATCARSRSYRVDARGAQKNFVRASRDDDDDDDDDERQRVARVALDWAVDGKAAAIKLHAASPPSFCAPFFISNLIYALFPAPTDCNPTECCLRSTKIWRYKASKKIS